jgi:hypothetical protein
MAVVTAVHAPTPDRPSVRVVFEADATPAAAGQMVHLWQPESSDLTIKSIIDPATVGLDPIRMLK